MLNKIIKGVVNKKLSQANLLNSNKEDLAKSRLKVCLECPIYNNGRCDRSKGGCGCFMETKVFCVDCTCPKNKW